MTYVNVKGGTNAGWRRVLEPIKPWVCECGRENKFSRSCLDCNAPQPS